MKILIVGNRGGTNVGASFERGGIALGHQVRLLEMIEASRGSVWLRRWNWWVRGKRPPWLGTFSRKVVETCRQERPACLLVTGIGPVDAQALQEIGPMGVRRINYLTDDPWNPKHRANWFFRALPHYDSVFSPRRANLGELRDLGGPRVEYVPFGYDPDWCFPDPGADRPAAEPPDDVFFAGTGDRDRVPYVLALRQAGFRIGLYGTYWDRYAGSRGLSHGQADPTTMRRAASRCKVALCLVRRLNRDGHVMRTFEVPAIGACMLAEDTAEHREILGPEGCNVVYFDSIPEMVEKTRWLLDHPQERSRLAAAAHRHIIEGGNTYGDRLAQMLNLDLACRNSSTDPAKDRPGESLPL